jgi:predicted ATPase
VKIDKQVMKIFLKRVSLLRDKVESFKDYPFSIPVIKNLQELKFTSNVTFFVGENGSGKSTLLESIADNCGFNLAGGSRNNTYNVHGTDAPLTPYLRLSWLPKVSNGFFLRADSFYNFSSYLDILKEENPGEDIYKYYGGVSLHKQSHGESFLSLFTNRFNGKAIYLLDEPEAALSPTKQLSLLKIIYDLSLKGESQFIIATHSPILLGYPNATIYSFDSNEIREIEYEMTDHYQITKYFLQNRTKFLEDIFS